MPPRARATKPAEPKSDAAKHAKAEGQPCPRCWPEGWPIEATSFATCIHGTWKR